MARINKGFLRLATKGTIDYHRVEQRNYLKEDLFNKYHYGKQPRTARMASPPS